MLPPALATDLAILRLGGAVVEAHQDHLVVRNPANPQHHWGNFVVVTDPDACNDADRWVSVFREQHPSADWVALGLVAQPSRPERWNELGLEVDELDALHTHHQPHRTEPPQGLRIRQFQESDWQTQVERDIAANRLSNEQPHEQFAAFVEASVQQRRELCDRGVAAWFGAFLGEALVSELGIVVCGNLARYQSVSTDLEHRGKGLASHLLGVAGQWAAERGCDEWVIVTEATNTAGRVYRRAGFEPARSSAQAYRHQSG